MGTNSEVGLHDEVLFCLLNLGLDLSRLCPESRMRNRPETSSFLAGIDGVVSGLGSDYSFLPLAEMVKKS